MSTTPYESVQEVANRLGITDGRIRQLLREGRFPGAIKEGSRERGVWRIIRNQHPAGPTPVPVRGEEKGDPDWLRTEIRGATR